MASIELDQWRAPELLLDAIDTFHTGAAITRSRIFLQELGVYHKIPLGGNETAQTLLKFFQQLELGFTISQRKDMENFRRMSTEFDELQPPSEADVEKEIKALGMEWQSKGLELDEMFQTLRTYRLSCGTLEYLRDQGSVAFANFLHKSDVLKLDELERKPTYWPHARTPDQSWEVITDLHKRTEAILFQRHPVDTTYLFQCSHFFTAAMNMAVEIDRNAKPQ